MIRATCLVAATAMLCNGVTLPSLVATYHRLSAHEPIATHPRDVTPAAYVVAAEKGNDGLFHLTGTVRGHRISFIVDTGATTTVLSAHDAARMGLPIRDDDETSTLRTASGSTSMVWKTLDRLEVAGSRLTDLEVVVARHGPDHSLLGQDALSQLGTVTITGERLEIRPPTA